MSWAHVHAGSTPATRTIFLSCRFAAEYHAIAELTGPFRTKRKGLRYAWRKLKIIDKAPVIDQYQNERQVEYVFDDATYQLWISNAEEPLRSASILARNSDIARVEMLNLEKDCVIIRKDPDEDGNYGDLIIKRGLKRRAPQTRP